MGSSPQASGAKAALSIAEFCAAYGISRFTFYDLRQRSSRDESRPSRFDLDPSCRSMAHAA
jgi:hypothetical protein